AVTDVGRVVYWAMRRRRLFRRLGGTDAGLVPDVIMAHTNDALVMNITRSDRPPRLLAGEPDGAHDRLFVIEGSDGSAPGRWQRAGGPGRRRRVRRRP